MKNIILVSVIIPTYRRADMLQRAIDSVLNQTYKNIEIIVVDDNNPGTIFRKNTEQLMNQYEKNNKVIYVKHDRNKNGATARNTGMSYSKGDYICFLDDDDLYKPEKIQKQIEYLAINLEYDAVYCGWIRNGNKVIPEKVGNLTFELLSGISLIYTNTIMIKRNIAIQIGGWDERFNRNQEAVFLLRYFKYGYKLGLIKEVLVEFDVSDRSNVSNPIKYEKDFDFFLKTHSDNIESCLDRYKNAKSIIYSYRYRGVLLNYLKNKEYKGAFKLYLKMIKMMPIKFNIDLIIYIFKRIIAV